MVLAHPEMPLHNNPVELRMRQRVRRRKISFGPGVADGTKAWDTSMSLADRAEVRGEFLPLHP